MPRRFMHPKMLLPLLACLAIAVSACVGFGWGPSWARTTPVDAPRAESPPAEDAPLRQDTAVEAAAADNDSDDDNDDECTAGSMAIHDRHFSCARRAVAFDARASALRLSLGYLDSLQRPPRSTRLV